MPDEFATREVIVLPDAPTAVERSAAKELADGIERMTGRLLPIIAESTVPEPSRRFYVGATRAAGPAADWKPDEILVKPVADGVILTGHPQRGAIYAVDTYLEDVCGVRWWTSTEAHYPSYGRVPQPAAEIRHASPFTYRETYYLDGFDADFKVRLKGNVSSLTRFMFAPMNFIPPEKGGDHRLYFFKGRRSAYHSKATGPLNPEPSIGSERSEMLAIHGRQGQRDKQCQRRDFHRDKNGVDGRALLGPHHQQKRH